MNSVAQLVWALRSANEPCPLTSQTSRSRSVFNIRRSVWRTHLKDETKTHEDDEDPGVVPILKPHQAGERYWLDVPEFDWRGLRFGQPR
jgi:hypothetical protein